MDSQADAQRALEYWRLEGWREIGRELGRGSYAAVVEVDYKGLKCVGKKIHRVLYENGERDLVRRFEEECRLLSQLRHPHIVQFLGVYFEEDTNVPVLVMEFLPITLAQALDRYGLLPEEINYSILRDVSLGLRYLHERPNPIVHRDLSANNVLLTRDMMAKISDLGVARMLGLTPMQINRMTQGPGTPCYMPPEALVPEPHYDVKIDIFSFGVLIVHVLSGEWPFPKEAVKVNPDAPSQLTPVSEMDRRQQSIEKIANDHPLMQLISQCLHNSPTERPQIADVCQQMDDLASQHPAVYENRVELLQQIKTALEESASLRDEVQALLRVRDTLIEQHAASITQLEEEFHSRMESAKVSSKSEIQRIQTDCDLRQCCNETEIQQLRASLAEVQNENLSLLEAQCAKDRVHESRLEAEKKSHKAQMDALVLQYTIEKDKQQAEITNLQISEVQIEEQLQAERKQYKSEINNLMDELQGQCENFQAQLQSQEEENETQLQAKEAEKEAQLQAKEVEKEAQLQAKETEKAVLMMELEESKSRVSRKEATIESLRKQLGQMQKMLLHNSQVHASFPPETKLDWRERASFPVGMNRPQAVLIDESIYVGGGATIYASDFTLMFKYNIIKNKWTQMPSTPVVYYGLSQLRNNVVLVGGSIPPSEEFKVVHTLHVLDDTQHWVESFSPMPTARRSPAVISYKGSALIVCGGKGDSGKLTKIVEIFKIETSQWCELHSLPFPWCGMSVAMMGDTCFLMGGWAGDDNLPTKAVIECRIDKLLQQGSDENTTTPWKALPDCPFSFSVGTVLNGCVLSVGGGKSGTVLPQTGIWALFPKQEVFHLSDHIYVYCPTVSKWIMIGKLPAHVAQPATVVLSTNKFLNFGGMGGNTYSSTVWEGKVGV